MKNFNLNLLFRYGPVTVLFTLVTVTAVLSLTLEREIFMAITFFFKFCWSLNIIRNDAQITLKRKCRCVNIGLLCILLIILIAIVIGFPCFGSQKDFFICLEVFEEYFGEWSFIPYYFYFAASPFLCYHFLRICFTFVYAILEAQLQYLIIAEYLFEIYQTNPSKRWKYLQDTRYQQQIGKSLRLSIVHHVVLKKFLKRTLHLTKIGMPFFLVLGILLLTSSFAFIMNLGDTMSNILKIRIFLFTTSVLCITILLCWIGQQLIDVTSQIFVSLSGAPWYFWNLENIKILLMFLTNCTKNESIILAGICLDYKLFVSVARLTVSYAVVLFKLHKSSLV
nr:PREDICTED: uncharacterized protein LOC107397668 [Tribolium castaneum]|eukprot:XP_015834058.1 PREDICTED: uncharacterized protein LOC107397668 [Tribolium castaneum]